MFVILADKRARTAKSRLIDYTPKDTLITISHDNGNQ